MVIGSRAKVHVCKGKAEVIIVAMGRRQVGPLMCKVVDAKVPDRGETDEALAQCKGGGMKTWYQGTHHFPPIPVA